MNIRFQCNDVDKLQNTVQPLVLKGGGGGAFLKVLGFLSGLIGFARYFFSNFCDILALQTCCARYFSSVRGMLDIFQICALPPIKNQMLEIISKCQQCLNVKLTHIFLWKVKLKTSVTALYLTLFMAGDAPM